MSWREDAKGRWVRVVEPDASFTLVATPKGDGRWSWAVYRGGAQSPMATGIANKLNAARSTAEQFLKGAGFL